MIRNVLVPLDGSRASEQVLGPVVKLLRHADGNLILLHAVTPSEYFSLTAAEYVQQERRRSATYLQGLAERLGKSGMGVRERVVTGEASREIVEEACRSRADLIAMSSHGRSGVREWAFGSVAERVLRTTGLPVLVLRDDGGKSHTLRKFLIALDGSEDALEVVEPAAELAAALGASVLLVYGGKTLPPSVPLAKKILLKHHVPFETRVLRGEPVRTIQEALRSEHADLLALTTTGTSGPDKSHFGRAAEELLKSCGLPLLVVHAGPIS